MGSVILDFVLKAMMMTGLLLVVYLMISPVIKALIASVKGENTNKN